MIQHTIPIAITSRILITYPIALRFWMAVSISYRRRLISHIYFESVGIIKGVSRELYHSVSPFVLFSCAWVQKGNAAQ